MTPRLAALIALLIACVPDPGWGAENFGTALVCHGKLNLLRGGQREVFDTPRTLVPIQLGDILRVAPNSLVIVRSREDSIIRLGGNAVLLLRPWRKKEKKGVVQMLYGRAIISNSRRDFRFNVKTPAAVIWVQNATYTLTVTPDGGTMIFSHRERPNPRLGKCFKGPGKEV